MANFLEFAQYKHNILGALMTHDGIVRAVANVSPRFLDDPPANLPQLPDDPFDLIHENVFPYNITREVQSETKTYISFFFRTPRLTRRNDLFREIEIHILVFCHHSLMRSAYAYSRLEYLIHEIDKMFNESRDFGFGKLEFVMQDEFAATREHPGYVLVYKTVDRNNNRCGR